MNRRPKEPSKLDDHFRVRASLEQEPGEEVEKDGVMRPESGVHSKRTKTNSVLGGKVWRVVRKNEGGPSVFVSDKKNSCEKLWGLLVFIDHLDMHVPSAHLSPPFMNDAPTPGDRLCSFSNFSFFSHPPLSIIS